MKNLIKNGILILNVISLTSDGMGQNNKDSTLSMDTTGVAKNTVYIELLGNGGLGSVNYEKVLSYGKKIYVTGRFGFGFFPFESVVFSIPTEISFVFNVNQTSHFEMGIGISYIRGLNSCKECDGGAYTSSSIYAALRVFGYRFQKKEGGFYLKTGFTPLIKLYEFDNVFRKNVANKSTSVIPLIGFGIGYTFKQIASN